MSEKNKNRWEHFSHKADVGIRGIGRTKAEAFEQAALAMTAVICEPEKIEPKYKVCISCDAKDDELLFADWLNKIIYEMDKRKMLFSRFEVTIDKGNLAGNAWGEKIKIQKHEPVVEVKAATYSELRVYKNEKGNWVGQCVVDV